MSDREHLQWLAEMFDEPVERLMVSTRRDDIPGWDSLGMLTLMADLDEKFSIQLTDGDIAGITTVGDLLELIRKRGPDSG